MVTDSFYATQVEVLKTNKKNPQLNANLSFYKMKVLYTQNEKNLTNVLLITVLITQIVN